MKNELEYIRLNYKNKTNKEIGNHLNLTARQVWSRTKKIGLVNPQRPMFDISETQEQIILSGIIGDGGLKKNGRFGYIYRECHAVDEADYLTWKFNKLHPLTKTTNITDIERRKETQLPQKQFCTTTTESLKKYYKMSRVDVIKKLDKLGLSLLILDDGYARVYSSKSISLHISVISLSLMERELLVDLFRDKLGVNSWLTNRKKVIALSVESTEVIYKLLLNHMDKNTDVLRKKFSIYY